MIREAIILAGGLGTRLRTAVPDLPKCMAPVAGRPFIYYVISHLHRQGISRFIFSLGYKHDLIRDYLAAEFPYLDYSCSIEEYPLGTGGAVLKAASLSTGQQLLIVNGDTYFDINVNELASFHEQHSSTCTLSLKPMHDSDRYGVVEISKEGKIISFKEKKWYDNSLINGGVYALNVEKFRDIHLPEIFSFEKDYLEKYFQDQKMYGIVQDKYFIDIGIPEDFNRAQEEMKKK